MNPTLIIAVVMFALTYVLLLTLSKYRAFVALGSAIIFSLWLIFLVPEVNFDFFDVLSGIDFNVLMMISGTMGIVSLFIKSGMPMKIADVLLSRFSSVKTAIVAMAVLSGIISAFVDNVATVLMLAPIALAVCKKQSISPVAPIICISVSSNLQGAATLVGDTTSVLLAKEAGMNFFDFFWFHGRPSIFWAVELGALATVFILLFLFRKQNQKLELTSTTEVKDLVPSFLMGGIILLLVIASFLPEPENEVLGIIYAHRNGLICILLLVIGLIISIVRTNTTEDVELVFSEMDYQTLLLLASLFVVITSIDAAGMIDMLANALTMVGGNNLFLLYTVIVFASVVISAFVDNIPYVMTMLPVVSGVAASMGCDPTVLYLGLLIGATLGGNITPIGASANITGIGILRREGHEVSVGEFMKISVPFTITAVLTGYLYIWIAYGIFG